ncbi:MAG: AAA family ATPase [Candidatus Midichloria sp.]|nr:AAA family ATPase [Candidatus Midichloria sp.]
MTSDMLAGIGAFKKMAIKSSAFVDKTLFIAEIVGIDQDAILITRPRRWGKTTNLDMLRTFLEVGVDECGNKKAVKTLTKSCLLEV